MEHTLVFSISGIEKAGRKCFASPAMRCARIALKQSQRLLELMLAKPDSDAKILSLSDQEWHILKWSHWLVPQSLTHTAMLCLHLLPQNCFLLREEIYSEVLGSFPFGDFPGWGGAGGAGGCYGGSSQSSLHIDVADF